MGKKMRGADDSLKILMRRHGKIFYEDLMDYLMRSYEPYHNDKDKVVDWCWLPYGYEVGTYHPWMKMKEFCEKKRYSWSIALTFLKGMKRKNYKSEYNLLKTYAKENNLHNLYNY